MAPQTEHREVLREQAEEEKLDPKQTILPWAVRSKKQNTNVADEESPLTSSMQVASSSVDPITTRLGNMVVTEEEPTVTTTPSATAEDIDAIADTEQQTSAKHTKPTRVPIFTSQPQELLKLITSLQNIEQKCCRRLTLGPLRSRTMWARI